MRLGVFSLVIAVPKESSRVQVPSLFFAEWCYCLQCRCSFGVPEICDLGFLTTSKPSKSWSRPVFRLASWGTGTGSFSIAPANTYGGYYGAGTYSSLVAQGDLHMIAHDLRDHMLRPPCRGARRKQCLFHCVEAQCCLVLFSLLTCLCHLPNLQLECLRALVLANTFMQWVSARFRCHGHVCCARVLRHESSHCGEIQGLWNSQVPPMGQDPMIAHKIPTQMGTIMDNQQRLWD